MKKTDLLYPAVSIVIVVLFFCYSYFESHAENSTLSAISILVFLLFVWLGLVAFLYFVIVGIGGLARGRLTRFALASISALILVGAICFRYQLKELSFGSIDALRFFANKNYYEELARSSEEKNPRGRVSISWGSGGFRSTNVFYDLVYEPADTLDLATLPKHERCKASARKLTSKYFVVETVCQ
jgi:hypothetical protein